MQIREKFPYFNYSLYNYWLKAEQIFMVVNKNAEKKFLLPRAQKGCKFRGV